MIDLKDLEGVVWHGSVDAAFYLKDIGVSQRRWRGNDIYSLYTIKDGEILRLEGIPSDKDYIPKLKNAPVVDIIEWAKSKEKPCSEEKSNSDEEIKSLKKENYEEAECYPVGSATFYWTIPKFGFGQIVIRPVHTESGIKVLIDSETMSKNFLIEMLTKMVENAELK